MDLLGVEKQRFLDLLTDYFEGSESPKIPGFADGQPAR